MWAQSIHVTLAGCIGRQLLGPRLAIGPPSNASTVSGGSLA